MGDIYEELLQRLAVEPCVVERDQNVQEMMEAPAKQRKGMAPRQDWPALLELSLGTVDQLAAALRELVDGSRAVLPDEFSARAVGLHDSEIQKGGCIPATRLPVETDLNLLRIYNRAVDTNHVFVQKAHIQSEAGLAVHSNWFFRSFPVRWADERVCRTCRTVVRPRKRVKDAKFQAIPQTRRPLETKIKRPDQLHIGFGREAGVSLQSRKFQPAGIYHTIHRVGVRYDIGSSHSRAQNFQDRLLRFACSADRARSDQRADGECCRC